MMMMMMMALFCWHHIRLSGHRARAGHQDAGVTVISRAGGFVLVMNTFFVRYCCRWRVWHIVICLCSYDIISLFWSNTITVLRFTDPVISLSVHRYCLTGFLCHKNHVLLWNHIYTGIRARASGKRVHCNNNSARYILSVMIFQSRSIWNYILDLYLHIEEAFFVIAFIYLFIFYCHNRYFTESICTVSIYRFIQ